MNVVGYGSRQAFVNFLYILKSSSLYVLAF